MSERPSAPSEAALEQRENLDQMQRELARIEKVYAEFIATRSDLTPEQKEFALNHMREHPEQEWGQSVDGHRIERTSDGDISVVAWLDEPGMGKYVMDPRIIPIPRELK